MSDVYTPTQLEEDTADWINKNSGPFVRARREISNKRPDILLIKNNQTMGWLEVKFNHTDNLVNPRFFFKNGIAYTNYDNHNCAGTLTELLNTNDVTQRFLRDLSSYTGISLNSIKIPTTRKQFQGEVGLITFEMLESFFSKTKDQYIAEVKDFDIGSLVTEDFNGRGVHYLQAADDFYRVGTSDPCEVGNEVPLFCGYGPLKVRISLRSGWFEIHPEIKVKKLPLSHFSCRPNTHKVNPFYPEGSDRY